MKTSLYKIVASLSLSFFMMQHASAQIDNTAHILCNRADTFYKATVGNILPELNRTVQAESINRKQNGYVLNNIQSTLAQKPEVDLPLFRMPENKNVLYLNYKSFPMMVKYNNQYYLAQNFDWTRFSVIDYKNYIHQWAHYIYESQIAKKEKINSLETEINVDIIAGWLINKYSPPLRNRIKRENLPLMDSYLSEIENSLRTQTNPRSIEMLNRLLVKRLDRFYDYQAVLYGIENSNGVILPSDLKIFSATMSNKEKAEVYASFLDWNAESDQVKLEYNDKIKLLRKLDPANYAAFLAQAAFRPNDYFKNPLSKYAASIASFKSNYPNDVLPRILELYQIMSSTSNDKLHRANLLADNIRNEFPQTLYQLTSITNSSSQYASMPQTYKFIVQDNLEVVYLLNNAYHKSMAQLNNLTIMPNLFNDLYLYRNNKYYESSTNNNFLPSIDERISINQDDINKINAIFSQVAAADTQ